MNATDTKRTLNPVPGCLIGCLVLLSPTLAQAERWYVEPRASLRAFYDDNVRLSIVNPISTFAGMLTAEVESGRRTEVSEIGLQGKINSSRYADAPDLDETDVTLGVTSAYQLGRSRFKFDGQLDHDSTLTSEISTSGYVQANKRRERFQLSPSWLYTLSPRTQVETTLSYEKVAYEDVDVIPLFDYSFARAGLTLTHALSERVQAMNRLSFDRYDATQVDTLSDSYGVEFGTSYQLSETTTLTGFAGVRHSRAETPTWFGIEESDNTGPLFQLTLNRRFEVGQLRLTAARSMLPSSSGTLLDTTSLGVGFDYPIGPRWTFSLNASGYRNRTPDGESSSNDRDYLSFSPKLSHRLSSALSLDLSYRYRWQQYDQRENDADSNAIYLGLQYSFVREPLGRTSVIR
jgi:opacity protein-like surface antigen